MTTLTDILLVKQKDGTYDIELENGDFKLDNGYKNSLLITFGTNARSYSSQVLNSENRRGWWGNQFNKTKTDDIGSRLWVISTKPISESSMNEGVALLNQAFSWYILEKLATNIDIKGVIVNDGYSFTIKIYNGNDIIESETFDLWRQTSAN